MWINRNSRQQRQSIKPHSKRLEIQITSEMSLKDNNDFLQIIGTRNSCYMNVFTSLGKAFCWSLYT